jgi:hypothetical protein
MATSMSVHHISDLSFKQEILSMPLGPDVRLMRVTAIDKNGESNDITFFLTENCQIEELIK